jgi:hypothetical protein
MVGPPPSVDLAIMRKLDHHPQQALIAALSLLIFREEPMRSIPSSGPIPLHRYRNRRSRRPTRSAGVMEPSRNILDQVRNRDFSNCSKAF